MSNLASSFSFKASAEVDGIFRSHKFINPTSSFIFSALPASFVCGSGTTDFTNVAIDLKELVVGTF